VCFLFVCEFFFFSRTLPPPDPDDKDREPWFWEEAALFNSLEIQFDDEYTHKFKERTAIANNEHAFVKLREQVYAVPIPEHITLPEQ
jgi:hypothetical protein